MAFHNLATASKQVRLTVDGILYQKAAGTTDTLVSNTLDTLGFDAVYFTGLLGAITATGTVAVTILESNDDGATDPYAPVSGVAVAVVAADAQKGWVLDLYRPSKRYLQVQQIRATANAAIDGLLAILYKFDYAPTAKDATTKNVQVFNHPA